MYEKVVLLIDTNMCSAVKWYQEVRGMKRFFELVLVYLIGVIFLVTLAFRVSAIERENVSDTSVASNYTITLSNYE